MAESVQITLYICITLLLLSGLDVLKKMKRGE